MVASPSIDKSALIVRLAQTDAEIAAAQRLRYAVFFEEYQGNPSKEVADEQRDFDVFDSVADHLIVLDTGLGDCSEHQVIGTYRLMREEAAHKIGQFYTNQEYDITSLICSGERLLEVGRSCVLPNYRNRLVLQQLWEGIGRYVAEHEIGLMFGCVSFPGTDPDSVAEQLAYLYHYCLAPDGLRPRTRDEFYVDMNRVPKDMLNTRDILAKLPPLVKGYIRAGAIVGDGAYIDRNMNTTDACIVLPTHFVKASYLKHYQRRTGKAILNETQQKARDQNLTHTKNAS